MKLLLWPISSSDWNPDRFCVISMEFLLLSLRRSSSRNVPQRRWVRRNICHLQARLSDVLVTSKGEIKLFLPHPLHAMLCRCFLSYLRKTTNTPSLNGGERGGVWNLLFSKVTLFEYNVSTILSPVVGSELEDAYLQVDPQHSKFWSGIVKSPCECWSLWFWMYGLPLVFLIGSFC